MQVSIFCAVCFGSTTALAGVKTGQLLGLVSDGSCKTCVSGLFEINIDTGAAAPIGAFPMDPSEGALAVGPDGTLYAAFATDSLLVIVDPTTGDLTEVGPFGFADVSGLAFAPDSTLYGYDAGSDQLIIVDVDTGEGTAVGPVELHTNGGLAFSPEGTLFGAGDGILWTIDPQTGESTFIGLLGFGVFGGFINGTSGLEFVGGTLYAGAATASGYIGLYEVNPVTGDATWIGFFNDFDPTWSMGGLAFLPGAGDADRDGDVDGNDYNIFVNCFTGPLDPGGDPLPVACVFLDNDDDDDIDCLDWEAFIVNWTEDEEPPTFAECDELPPCEGDANGDDTVDPLDAGFVSARFGCPVGTGDRECDAADQSGDGLVDPLDLGYVLARFGNCP